MGGQSVPMFDFYLAPYVALTYAKQIAQIAKFKLDLSNKKAEELKNELVYYWAKHRLIMNDKCKVEIVNKLKAFFKKNNIKCSEKRVNKILSDAHEETYNETYQSMEAFIHNLNTMHCLPASERIWVYDVKLNSFKSMSMEELDNIFEPNRFKVISLNKQTGRAEFKFITHSKKLDNHRRIAKLTDVQGRVIKVTDNHRIMTIDNKSLEITEHLPSGIETVLSPRGIDFPIIKYDMCLSDYLKYEKDDPIETEKYIIETFSLAKKIDHILVDEKFAKFIGYYIGAGKINTQTGVCHIATKNAVEAKCLKGIVDDAFKTNVNVVTAYIENGRKAEFAGVSIKLGVAVAKLLEDKFGNVPTSKKIAIELMFADKDTRKEFLRAFIDSYTPEYVRDSNELKKQIQLLSLSVGMEEDTYNLSMIRSKYKAECEHIGNEDNMFTYANLSELIDEYDKAELEKFNNIYINTVIDSERYSSGEEYVYDISVEGNENFLTYDCIYVHNSRAGAQVPFSSINYGTDISTEGRMVMKALLETTDRGLGNGETPIFPIQIFKLKKGISYNKDDPNYDLFELACRVSARRLYPNFDNLDAPFNIELYKDGHPETEVAYMGCVESAEYIVYKLDDVDYTEPFEVAYNRVKKALNNEYKQGNAKYIECGSRVKIQDSNAGEYIEVKKFIKNENVNNFKRLKFTGGYSLTATADHPLPILNKGRTYVKDLQLGDRIEVAKFEKKSYDNHLKTKHLGNGLDTAYHIGKLMDLSDIDYSQAVKNYVYDINKNIAEENLANAFSELNSLYGVIEIQDNNKIHCREKYLTSDLLTMHEEERKALLAGLIDTDGTIETAIRKRGTARVARFKFTGKDKRAMLSKLALIRELGIPVEFYKSYRVPYNMTINAMSTDEQIPSTPNCAKDTVNNIATYNIEFEITDEIVSYMRNSDKIAELKIYEYDKMQSTQIVELIDIKDNVDDNEVANISYDVETETDRFDITFIRSHNCRTRVGTNVYDKTKEIIPGRGNLSFTSINLPRLAILSHGNIDTFFRLLDSRLELVHRQLLERFELQCNKHPLNYPFLMGQGVWIDSDKLGPNDDIRAILKHGTLTVGFIGLAETLVALIGKHHGESVEAQQLGLRIVQHMRDYTDAWSRDEQMNYSIIGTPAEGLSGRFVRIDKEKFGIIKGVTDKDYYTNSSHKMIVALCSNT